MGAAKGDSFGPGCSALNATLFSAKGWAIDLFSVVVLRSRLRDRNRLGPDRRSSNVTCTKLWAFFSQKFLREKDFGSRAGC